MKETYVFIGVSIANLVSKEMIRSMNEDTIIFAMANPVPEIMPDDAFEAGAKIVGAGRSDFPNQVNNVLAFPGIFRAALDVRAKEINKKMKQAAAYALVELIAKDDLKPDYVIPKPFDPQVGPNVAAADTGVARIEITYYDELEKVKKIMGK
ncbi:NADP-dependent malic enzyme [Halanaerobium saccharolyticum subsp. saccharolyticum DSM 6643]|uniref:NADP-dependent malic enzyme n=1 Tax=Halanaerobium saccharolyticum subsp. saccharolyticum DSM 6643 TaxID=1293054 RepID=M5EDE2_9FIRM|nr:NADP-dependent malic enzyme [Halanaerobium saccharolyticum subsp. saccharolyticum DSM 6643]